jgi:5-methylcytosine-specific restriction endonuclease McrA
MAAVGAAVVRRHLGRGNTTMLLTALGQRKVAAWNNASKALGYHPDVVRRDAYGWYMRWSDYGNRNSDYGWEIDHTVPLAVGGSDSHLNLRALHWRNNASRGAALGGIAV